MCLSTEKKWYLTEVSGVNTTRNKQILHVLYSSIQARTSRFENLWNKRYWALTFNFYYYIHWHPSVLSDYGGSTRQVDSWASSSVTVHTDAWLAVAVAALEGKHRVISPICIWRRWLFPFPAFLFRGFFEGEFPFYEAGWQFPSWPIVCHGFPVGVVHFRAFISHL